MTIIWHWYSPSILVKTWKPYWQIVLQAYPNYKITRALSLNWPMANPLPSLIITDRQRILFPQKPINNWLKNWKIMNLAFLWKKDRPKRFMPLKWISMTYKYKLKFLPPSSFPSYFYIKNIYSSMLQIVVEKWLPVCHRLWHAICSNLDHSGNSLRIPGIRHPPGTGPPAVPNRGTSCRPWKPLDSPHPPTPASFFFPAKHPPKQEGAHERKFTLLSLFISTSIRIFGIDRLSKWWRQSQIWWISVDIPRWNDISLAFLAGCTIIPRFF